VLDGDVKIVVEAGCGLMRLVNWCTGKGLSGLEFAAGIPGSVGGAISMNAGAWGGEMAAVVDAITFVTPDGEVQKKTRSELAFSYRHLEKGHNIVALGELLLKPGSRESIAQKAKDVVARRKKSQPQGVASAGSFFKNPQGDAAGRLIEAAGLKGCSAGGAMVSPIHANFIINTGSATAADVMALMKTVQERVQQRFGVMLEPEVSIIGDW
jgi:UDP-N-acetylmuramate dehydrogenase